MEQAEQAFVDMEENALVQRPPWEMRWWEKSRSRSRGRGGRGGRGDDRARLGTRPNREGSRRTEPGGTGSDGNDHRPWRRQGRAGTDDVVEPVARRTSSVMSARPESSSTGARPSRSAPPVAHGLPESFRQHAWHCLLEMSNATQHPGEYSYGVSTTAMNNIGATFVVWRQRKIAYVG